jgi:hypothetical protein
MTHIESRFRDEGEAGFFEAKGSKIRDCAYCHKEVKELQKPGLTAMNCWKLLALSENEKEHRKIRDWLYENYEKYKLAGKWLPSARGDAFTVFVLYFLSKEDMWLIRKKLVEEFIERRILPLRGSFYLPYQRGGDYYEPKFGPWRTWCVKYHPELVKIRFEDLESLICPFCNEKLRYIRRGKLGFYGCRAYPACKFMLPELHLFEVVSDGYAEYEIYGEKGGLKGRIFSLHLEDKRVKISEVNIK